MRPVRADGKGKRQVENRKRQETIAHEVDEQIYRMTDRLATVAASLRQMLKKYAMLSATLGFSILGLVRVVEFLNHRVWIS